jgi:hypothetical protein
VVGEVYRRIFVNVPNVVEAMSRFIPVNADVLDVGGGDGYVASQLLDRRQDIRITITDIPLRTGSFISARNLSRATLLAGKNVLGCSVMNVCKDRGKVGWGGRDRTFECRNQNPVPYRLATPQNAR